MFHSVFAECSSAQILDVYACIKHRLSSEFIFFTLKNVASSGIRTCNLSFATYYSNREVPGSNPSRVTFISYPKNRQISNFLEIKNILLQVGVEPGTSDLLKLKECMK